MKTFLLVMVMTTGVFEGDTVLEKRYENQADDMECLAQADIYNNPFHNAIMRYGKYEAVPVLNTNSFCVEISK